MTEEPCQIFKKTLKTEVWCVLTSKETHQEYRRKCNSVALTVDNYGSAFWVSPAGEEVPYILYTCISGPMK